MGKKRQTIKITGVQPSVLRWARESQGYSLEDVAIHLKRDVVEVASWEAGTATPTYPQLEVLAYTLYKRLH
jgi:ribosome-binding protein aMBF1 (putative translation factor)